MTYVSISNYRSHLCSVFYICMPSKYGIRPSSYSYAGIMNAIILPNTSPSKSNVNLLPSPCHTAVNPCSLALLGGRKYPPSSPSALSVYHACLKSFRALPIAALVDGRFFCVHGGISPELITLDDVDRVSDNVLLISSH